MLDVFRGSRPLAYVTAGVVAAAAAGGGGWALAASSGGVLHACANKKNGALRLAGKCKRGVEHSVSWNVQGPQGVQGAQGLQGLQGQQGTTGPVGPSNAYSGSITGPVTITSTTTPGDKVGHLNLPPGSYVIFAKAWLENQSTTTATTTGCELDAGSDSDIDFLKVEPSGTNAFRGAVALNVAHTFSSAGTAQLSCITGGGVTVTANNAVVTAIQVSSLTGNALIPG
jgi:hypothetical protein